MWVRGEGGGEGKHMSGSFVVYRDRFFLYKETKHKFEELFDGFSDPHLIMVIHHHDSVGFLLAVAASCCHGLRFCVCVSLLVGFDVVW